MNMKSKHVYFLLNGVIVLLVIALLGGAYGLDKVLSAQSDKLVRQRSELAALDTESTALLAAKQEVKQYQSLADIAKSIVPQDKDQAQTVREIVKIAQASGVSLGSISFPSSTLGAGKSLSLSQLTAVPGLSGVYKLQINVQSSTGQPVTYQKFRSFLSGLEHNRRTALVSTITLTPDSKDSNLIMFSLILDEYIKP
jgi:hypothetical protein